MIVKGKCGMQIKKCSDEDIELLALLNKQLIDDEKSDNTMTVEELRNRMKDFTNSDYDAYFFVENNDILGYALVNHTVKPFYLRQFFIDRNHRKKHIGTKAFQLLLEELETDSIDIEVLSWNTIGNKFWEKCGFVERSRYMRFEKK